MLLVFFSSSNIFIKGRDFLPKEVSTLHLEKKYNEQVPGGLSFAIVDLNFQNKLQRLRYLQRQVLSSLPSKTHLLKNAHEPHIALAELSTSLGRLRESWDNEPLLYDEALEFYQRCVSNAAFITAMRALCMHNVQLLSQKMGKEIEIPDAKDIDEIKELVMQLNQT